MDASLIAPAPAFQPVVAPRDDSDTPLATQLEVKAWLKNINEDRAFFKPQFDMIRTWMEFVYGFQWESQEKLDDQRYTNNITLRMVNQKVASLYARNPKVQVSRRKRMDYVMWDEDINSLLSSLQSMESMGQGVPPNPEAVLTVQDFQQADKRKKMIDRICKTAEIVYDQQTDTHKPEFKEQFKQLVRRTIICGVGYVKVRLCRNDYDEQYLSTVTLPNDVRYRMDKARMLVEGIESGTIDNDGEKSEEVKSLLKSIASSPDDGYIGQYLDFDFPSSLSIVPSRKTRNLKEWVACPYLTQIHEIPLSVVNAMFDKNILPGGRITISNDPLNLDSMPSAGLEQYREGNSGEHSSTDPIVTLYEVLDHEKKERAYLLEGYHDYILPWEPLYPEVDGFWNIFALTFNDTEPLPDGKASIFPPSDVRLVMDAQREYNRTRDALRDHRNASLPKYMAREGIISEQDMEAIKDCEPNHVCTLKDVPPEMPLEKAFTAMQLQPVDPTLYAVEPQLQDIQNGVGMQEANLGAAQPGITATNSTIAEQSRLTTTSSNIDDLDGLQTRVADCAIQMCFRGMAPETVKRIAGPGAAWPTLDLEDWLHEIVVKIKAASSGKPNQALRNQQKQMLAPLLLQAGANPFGIVRWLANDMEDELNVDDLLPIQLPNMQPPVPPQGGPPGSMAGPGQQIAAQAGGDAPQMGRPSPQAINRMEPTY